MTRDRTETIRQQFGGAAAAYATSALHAAGPDLPLLRDAASLTGREKVLDLGCGAGHTGMALAALAGGVLGVDVTPEMARVADHLAKERRIPNIGFAQADAVALPFADRTFDVVTSRYSGHHFPDPVATLYEAARVLVPGGRFLLVDTVAPEDPALDTFCNTFELLRDPSHARAHRASEWVRMLAGVGIRAQVLHRLPLAVDGESWVKRAQTSAERVEMIRSLFSSATPAQRAAFELREHPWGFSQPVAIIRGVTPTT